jgi:UDP-N-acetylmuramoyl-tripeptide--D-alanyl-D-alanine ligase
MSIPELHQHFLKYSFVCTDTRKIKKGAIFFAIKGDNFNGNTFAQTAIEQGCSLAIVDEKEFATQPQIVLVNNVLECLQELANFHRKYWGKKIIALTGSNGKTTTKELIYAALKQKYNCIATYGNLNNHIGVPLTLLEIRPEHDLAIVEMGANHQKEIELLCKIAEPDFGIITNVGKAHLEGFGGEEGVLKGKGEMYTHIQKNNKSIFINSDDEKLSSIAEKIKSVTYGFNKPANVKGSLNEAGIFVELDIESNSTNTHIASNLTGKFNGINILCAFAVAHEFGLTNDEIKKGIESYHPDNSRSQLKKTDKNTLILDAYNANPTSMLLAIENLAQVQTENKFFVLGDMLEMGTYAEAEHLNILKKVQELKLQGIFVGKQFSEFKNQFTYTFFEDSVQAKNFLLQKKIENNVVLIKGSRGIKLENTIEAF